MDDMTMSAGRQPSPEVTLGSSGDILQRNAKLHLYTFLTRNDTLTQGLSHITFIVRDLDKMEEVLTQVLDAKKIYDSCEKTFSISKERFFDVGGVWIATMEGDPLVEKTYNHVAFKMSSDQHNEKLRLIRSLGLEVREGRSRVEGEGHSIYFYDYDNHLLELHSGTLEERLDRYARA